MVPSTLSIRTTLPPVGRRLVVRQRLYDLLDAGMRRKLTLICAASGYGKTTVVAAWLQQRRARAAWLTLEDNDQDFATIFSYLVAALEPFVPALQGRYRDLRYPTTAKPSVRTLMQDLLDVLHRCDDELAIVLDDYHNVQSDSIHAAVRFLVDYLPANLHLFILSRAELPFKHSDWRVKDVCQEITTADLRCSDDEAQQFVELNSPLNVAPGEVEQLNRVTEGWITGLKLATLSIERSHSSARLLDQATDLSHLFSAYLLEEVLSNQTVETKDFLLKTSILGRMSASLCDRLGPFVGSARILEGLEKENVFIFALDSARRWYRYHQIFQEFLHRRLEAEQPSIIECLHQRAAEWYREEGMLELAVDHALRGRMYPLAASLTHALWATKWAKGEVESLLNWLTALPVGVLGSYPDLVALYAELLFGAGKRDRLARLLEAIDAGGVCHNLSVDDANQLTARLAIIRGNLAQRSGDFVEIARAVKQAEPLLSPSDLKWRSNLLMQKGWLYEDRNQAPLMEEAYWAAFRLRDCGKTYCDPTPLTFLANRLFATGRMAGTIEACRSALDSLFSSKFSQNLMGVHYLILGCALHHQGKLEAATTHLRTGLERIDPAHDDIWRLDGLYFLIQANCGLGQLDAARDYLAAFDEAFQHGDKKQLLMSHYRGLRVRIAMLTGDRQSVQEWAQLYNPDSPARTGYTYFDFNCPFVYTPGFDRLTLVRYLLWVKDYTRARAYLDRWIDGFRSRDRLAELLEALVYAAIANYHLRRLDASVNLLLDALVQAEPDGYVQLFRNETATINAILLEARPQHLDAVGISPERSTAVLTFLDQIFPDSGFSESLAPPPDQLLTARETEILRLIDNGVSNADIAARFYISDNTVRTHIKSIYRKLQAQSRTHAIHRARELGILL